MSQDDTNTPRFITGNYVVCIEIDLLEAGIDPADVTDFEVRWDTLYITHIDGSVTEHELPDLDFQGLDVKYPGYIQVIDDEARPARFPECERTPDLADRWVRRAF